MGNLKTKSLISLFGAACGLINLVAKPIVAEEIQLQSSNSEQIGLNSRKIDQTSTKAKDLVIPLNKFKAEQLVQRELDLEKFCQDYPYNSRCNEASPAREGVPVERSPIPVPAPPPPSENQNEDSRANGQSRSGWAIVPEVSTLGFGGTIVRKITPNFNARVGVNTFRLGIDIDETEFDYEGDLNLFNVSSIIDLHPFKGSGFRVSGGLIVSNNNIEGTADVSDRVADEIGDIEVDGQSIDIRDFTNIEGLATIDADIEINRSVAPYLGIGGGNAVGAGKGLGFWWNLGVIFGGSPDAEVTSNISDSLPETIREEAEAAANAVLEDEERDLEDELDVIGVYPVVSLGLSYQF